MRVVPIVLTTVVLGAAAVAVLGPRGFDPPRTDHDTAAVDVLSEPTRPERTTGKLVVRVRTADGMDVPPTTVAGYVVYGERRLRRAASDGTFPFTDAPVGRLDVTAEAPGYVAETVRAFVVAGVDGAEPIVTLTPVK